MNSEEHSLLDILTRSVRVIGRNLVMYLLPLPYLVFGGLFVFGLMYISLVVILGVTFMNLAFTETTQDAISVSVSGAVYIFLFFYILLTGFLTGYIGGLGQMLKTLLSTGQLKIGEFMTGAFRYGPRLFLGLAVFLILIAIPSLWAIKRVLANYAIFDFATMESGWNSQLRTSISNAQSGIYFQTKIIQLIIFLLLGFWWIVSITETRHFVVSFKKSVVFLFQNPVKTIVSLIGVLAVVYFIPLGFSYLFQVLRFMPDYGGLFGLYLVLPLIMIYLIQVYNPDYFHTSAPVADTGSVQSKIEIDINPKENPDNYEDVLIDLHDNQTDDKDPDDLPRI